jgi:hypothetical protein
MTMMGEMAEQTAEMANSQLQTETIVHQNAEFLVMVELEIVEMVEMKTYHVRKTLLRKALLQIVTLIQSLL